MKRLIIEALRKWFTGAAALRLAETLMKALLDGLRGKASPAVIEALRLLVQVLAQEHAAKAADVVAADLSRRGMARIRTATVQAVEMGELAEKLREMLPPEDPRVDLEIPNGETIEYRASVDPDGRMSFAGPIGDVVPAEPHPERYRPAPAGVKTWTEPEPTTET